MAQADVDSIATAEEDFARPPRKPPKQLQADVSDKEPDDDESEDEAEEKKPAPLRPNRKARRAAQSESRRKSKVKDRGEDDEDGDDEDDASPRPSPEEVLKLIMTELTVAPEIAGLAHGIGRNTVYDAIHKGQIAANRVGNKLTCPTAPLRRQLGIDPPLPGEPPMQIAVKRKKQESIKSPKLHRRSR